MFYAILAVLFVLVIAIFCLSASEKRNFATTTAKLIDACFSGFGAGTVVLFLAKYLTNLFN